MLPIENPPVMTPEPRPKFMVPLLSVIIVLLVVVIVLLIVRKPAEAPESDTQTISETSATLPSNAEVITEWRSLTSSGLLSLAQQEPIYLMPDNPITLQQTVDLTGDGTDEAIFVGNGGNNDLSFIMIRDAEGNKVIAQQKSKNGLIGPVTLLGVGRVIFQAQWKLLPAEHGFYTASLFFDQNAETFKCNENGVSAYVWNASTRIFEWNQTLTEKYTIQVCN